MARVGRGSFTLLGKAGSGFAQAITTSAERKHDYKAMSDAAKKDQIEIYLQDHYAGGVGALELLEHSIKEHAGTPLAAFFAELHGEIKADHEQLYNLMTTLGLKIVARATRLRGWRRNLAARNSASPTATHPGCTCFRPWRVSFSESPERSYSGAPCTPSGSLRQPFSRWTLSDLERRAIEQSNRVEIKRLETARDCLS